MSIETLKSLLHSRNPITLGGAVGFNVCAQPGSIARSLPASCSRHLGEGRAKPLENAPKFVTFKPKLDEPNRLAFVVGTIGSLPLETVRAIESALKQEFSKTGLAEIVVNGNCERTEFDVIMPLTPTSLSVSHGVIDRLQR